MYVRISPKWLMMRLAESFFSLCIKTELSFFSSFLQLRLTRPDNYEDEQDKRSSLLPFLPKTLASKELSENDGNQRNNYTLNTSGIVLRNQETN